MSTADQLLIGNTLMVKYSMLPFGKWLLEWEKSFVKPMEAACKTGF
jgi:hypothetical protein